jgi:hypothetical protein
VLLGIETGMVGSVPFVTDRFGITPQDAIAVHVEVLDPNGGLLGANILAAIA